MTDEVSVVRTQSPPVDAVLRVAEGDDAIVVEQHVAELASVRTELATEASTEKYLRSFEEGSMLESVCGTRLKELADTVGQLRHRESELNESCEAPQQEPTEEEAMAMRTQIRDALTQGNPSARKSFVQNLVAEVRVTGSRRIQPVFRVPIEDEAEPPSARGREVRAMSGLAHPAGFEPATIGLEVRCSIH